MYAMLKAVNIRSHFAIINAGYDELPVERQRISPEWHSTMLSFACPRLRIQFGLSAPVRKKPFGKLGNFTENRNAFLITENGGIVVPTPGSKPEDNVMKTVSFIQFAGRWFGECLC